MKLNLKILLTALFFVYSNSYSQNNLDFEIDYSAFKYEQDVLLEVYYSFYLSQLTYNKTASGYEAAGFIGLQIVDSLNSKIVFDRQFKVPSEMSDTAGAITNQKLLGQLNLVIKPSLYVLRVTAKDYNNEPNSVSFDKIVEVKDMNSSALISSSVQISDKIEKSVNEKSVFYKNGLEVTPNPSRLFGNNIPSLFYYFELYNLEAAFPGKEYEIILKVSDDKSQIKEFSRKYSVKSNSKVEFGSIDISSLASGKYNLSLLIRDKNSADKLTVDNTFWIYNINSDQNDIRISGIENTEYENMDSALVEDEIEKISYLLSEKSYNNIKSIKAIYEKKVYLIKFWQSMDPSPGTEKNEFKSEYFERIKYANEHLKNNYQQGWKSDRGRVMAIYGKPDEIERFDFTSDTRPYEIWHYNSIQGGVIFAFVDISNVGNNYILAHSNAKGELFDENWRRRLDPIK